MLVTMFGHAVATPRGGVGGSCRAEQVPTLSTSRRGRPARHSLGPGQTSGVTEFNKRDTLGARR
jgi:hypothetical protein